ncbi:MAG: hypothetical protein GXP62_11630 [Oligoflexia bacterium]|nr:hypothetical protein [Oligoflexia bacterium]
MKPHPLVPLLLMPVRFALLVALAVAVVVVALLPIAQAFGLPVNAPF